MNADELRGKHFTSHEDILYEVMLGENSTRVLFHVQRLAYYVLQSINCEVQFVADETLLMKHTERVYSRPLY